MHKEKILKTWCFFVTWWLSGEIMTHEPNTNFQRVEKKKIVFYDSYLNESGIKGGSCVALYNLIVGLSNISAYRIIILSNTLDNPFITKYKNLGVEVIN